MKKETEKVWMVFTLEQVNITQDLCSVFNGSFTDKQDAIAEMESLECMGYSAFIQKVIRCRE